ncbi:MAG: NrpR regulatory domain-containing protein [Candidatus Margulisiibacteriota bacterium]
MEKKLNTILKIVAESTEPIGSPDISVKLKELGIEMSERTVRHHLQQLGEEGLVKVFWKEGRMLTRKGKEELGNSMISEKIGLVSARIESLSYKMTFDLASKQGSLIFNLTYFHKSEFKKALKIMAEAFKKKFCMGQLVSIAEAGEEVSGVKVPAGKVCLGTMCATNLNGILLKSGIPVESKFGGVLQIEDGEPLRFTELVSYSGSTLDPHEIFIRSKMTNVRGACKGSGKILAGLREIPAAAKDKAEEIMRQAEQAGFGNAIYIGKPGQPVLGMPVGVDRVGLVIPGGLNPVAACEELGIETESQALSALVDYSQLKDFKTLL